MNRAGHNQASISSMDRNGFSLRLGYVGYLSAVALCSGLAFVGVCRGEFGLLVGALVAGGVVAGLRVFLRSEPVLGAGRVSEREELGVFRVEAGRVSTRVGELAGLLRAWSDLERARGTRGFDAWAWQSLRVELRERLRDDVELRRLLGLAE